MKQWESDDIVNAITLVWPHGQFGCTDKKFLNLLRSTLRGAMAAGEIEYFEVIPEGLDTLWVFRGNNLRPLADTISTILEIEGVDLKIIQKVR